MSNLLSRNKTLYLDNAGMNIRPLNKVNGFELLSCCATIVYKNGRLIKNSSDLRGEIFNISPETIILVIYIFIYIHNIMYVILSYNFQTYLFHNIILYMRNVYIANNKTKS